MAVHSGRPHPLTNGSPVNEHMTPSTSTFTLDNRDRHFVENRQMLCRNRLSLGREDFSERLLPLLLIVRRPIGGKRPLIHARMDLRRNLRRAQRVAGGTCLSISLHRTYVSGVRGIQPFSSRSPRRNIRRYSGCLARAISLRPPATVKETLVMLENTGRRTRCPIVANVADLASASQCQ